MIAFLLLAATVLALGVVGGFFFVLLRLTAFAFNWRERVEEVAVKAFFVCAWLVFMGGATLMGFGFFALFGGVP